MTKVSFYVLPEGQEKLHFACRLTEKAFKQGQRIYLYGADAQTCGALDDLLWTFRQGSFVPHQLWNGGSVDAATPVIIGSSEPPPDLDATLVNVADDVPDFFSRFERVAEIVDSAGKEPARRRYKFYQDRGYPLETHKIEAA